ncbi:hypothetical protein CEXT_722931 [Caerostris extrusa]|uniref:TonB C-terminal domain-containing protein n=1 Tax=Caerostris extrusa TaxID=172846 RepID=A0AAV4WV91_CAEEX|nr:hypothetical protein CEXT_722931 [Caerostris extrusa]
MPFHRIFHPYPSPFRPTGYVTVTINYRGESEQIKLNKLNAVFRSAEFIRSAITVAGTLKMARIYHPREKPKRLQIRTIIITTIEPSSLP